MGRNWVDEAVQAGELSRRADPDAIGLQMSVFEGVEASTPRPEPRAGLSWWLLCALSSSLLLAVLFPPAPVSATAARVFEQTDAPTYTVWAGAEGATPAGIGVVRSVGGVGVATVSGRWASMDSQARRDALLELGRRAAKGGVQEVVAFEADGRLVGRSRAGIVEVYP